jgi:hypothetical protein
MPDSPSSTSPAGMPSRISTYVIANGTKVVGAYLVLKEQAGEGRNSVLIVGAIMILGAQTVEAVLLRVIDRFFGGEDARQ